MSVCSEGWDGPHVTTTRDAIDQSQVTWKLPLPTSPNLLIWEPLSPGPSPTHVELPWPHATPSQTCSKLVYYVAHTSIGKQVVGL